MKILLFNRTKYENSIKKIFSCRFSPNVKPFYSMFIKRWCGVVRELFAYKMRRIKSSAGSSNIGRSLSPGSAGSIHLFNGFSVFWKQTRYVQLYVIKRQSGGVMQSGPLQAANLGSTPPPLVLLLFTQPSRAKLSWTVQTLFISSYFRCN